MTSTINNCQSLVCICIYLNFHLNIILHVFLGTRHLLIYTCYLGTFD